MNTRSIIIGTCLVGTLTGLGYLAWYLYGDTEDTDSRADLAAKKQPAAPQHHHKLTKQRTSTGPRPRYTNKSYPLRYGIYHPDVAVLQRYLKATYNANLGRYGKNKDGVDGHFGNVTKNAALKHLKKQVFTEKDIAEMKAALN